MELDGEVGDDGEEEEEEEAEVEDEVELECEAEFDGEADDEGDGEGDFDTVLFTSKAPIVHGERLASFRASKRSAPSAVQLPAATAGLSTSIATVSTDPPFQARGWNPHVAAEEVKMLL